jgi:hypothetical protein
MSTSRNTNQLAKKLSRSTRLSLSTAFRLARQADMYLGSLVVDSPDPHQRRLEAYVAHVLADGFKDRQLNGALLGVRRAVPDGRSVKLTLESEMADEVLRELLPRIDHFYGGVRGVPGLRVTRKSEGRLFLYDKASSAHITVVRADGGLIRLPSMRDGEVPLWKGATSDFTPSEKQETAEWTDSRGITDVRVRDVLLSRVLRSPALVNRTAEPHGFANCYTHHAGDLVIEWCCGVTVETLCAVLLAHGFAGSLSRSDAFELLSQRSAHLGDRTVILNRHEPCMYKRGTDILTRHIRKGYEA